MDARQRRTRERLDAAILELAAATPIEGVTVADVARRAGIARDTFYRWSASPVHLLADTLGRRLDDALRSRTGSGKAGTAAASTAEAGTMNARTRGRLGSAELDSVTEGILAFVAEHAEIYRLASQPRLDATLRDGLVSRIERILVEWLDAHPSIVPRVDARQTAAFARSVYVAYAASGVVGAYEVWLAEGDLTDIPGIEALIYQAAATWWRADEGDPARAD